MSRARIKRDVFEIAGRRIGRWSNVYKKLAVDPIAFFPQLHGVAESIAVRVRDAGKRAQHFHLTGRSHTYGRQQHREKHTTNEESIEPS
jgi:hypothetical protein